MKTGKFFKKTGILYPWPQFFFLAICRGKKNSRLHPQRHLSPRESSFICLINSLNFVAFAAFDAFFAANQFILSSNMRQFGITSA